MSATATGVVRTPDGWPVSGARITLIDGSGAQVGNAIAAADGTFSLAGLRPGPATLLVAAPGHEPRARGVVVPDGAWDLGTVPLTRTGATNRPPVGLWVIDPAHSSISAQARHLGLATVRGHFDEFGGVIQVAEQFERSTTSVEIAAATVSTGNATRDGHLRSADFLDVEHHPTITYTSDRLEQHGGDWVVVGRLAMAGSVRPVNLTMTYQGSGPDPWGGTRVGFSASTQLRRQDFAMNWNMAVGLGLDTLGTTLRVDLEVEAVRQD